jgi:signal transduction histidine kinase
VRSTSLVARLTLIQQLVASVVIVVFAASSLWLTDRSLRRAQERQLAETAHRVAESVDREYAEERDLPRASRAALEEETDSGLGIMVYGPQDTLLASNALANRTGYFLPPPSSTARVIEHGGRRWAAATESHGARVVTSISYRELRGSVSALARSLAWCAVPILVVTWFASRWTARRALRPLAQMDERARNAAVEAGVTSLGGPTGMAEIDRLAASFDRLLERLDGVLRSERRFTSEASHELRTPLTVLSGELEMALAGPALPPATRAALDRSAAQVDAMRALVDALLLLRRAGQGAPAARAPGRATDLGLDAPDEVMVSGHAALLASAVGNLVDNALKFTTGSTRVRVTVASDGAMARVVVEDGGAGIRAEDRERVFDPFFRGAEARAHLGGFGLGLPLLREVARAHGGDATLDDSPLGGARFTMSIPAWRAAPGASIVAPPWRAATASSPRASRGA